MLLVDSSFVKVSVTSELLHPCSDWQCADRRQIRGRKLINLFSSWQKKPKEPATVGTKKTLVFEPGNKGLDLELARATCSSAFALRSDLLTRGNLCSRMKRRWVDRPWMTWHIAIHITSLEDKSMVLQKEAFTKTDKIMQIIWEEKRKIVRGKQCKEKMWEIDLSKENIYWLLNLTVSWLCNCNLDLTCLRFCSNDNMGVDRMSGKLRLFGSPLTKCQ